MATQESESTSLPIVDNSGHYAEGRFPAPFLFLIDCESLCSHRLTDQPTKLTSPGSSSALVLSRTSSATSDHHLEEKGCQTSHCAVRRVFCCYLCYLYVALCNVCNRQRTAPNVGTLLIMLAMPCYGCFAIIIDLFVSPDTIRIRISLQSMQSRPECDIQTPNQDEHSPIIILWMGWAGTAGFGRQSKTLRVRRFRLAALFFFETGRRRDYGNRREDEWRQIDFSSR